MSTKHCKNATTLSQKRLVRCQTQETFNSSGTMVLHTENNLNLVGHTDEIGVVNFYAGRDHMATTETQQSTPT